MKQNLPFAAECDFKPGGNASVMGGYYLPPGQDLTLPPPGYKTAEYDMSQPNNVDYSGGNNTSGDVEVSTNKKKIVKMDVFVLVDRKL